MKDKKISYTRTFILPQLTICPNSHSIQLHIDARPQYFGICLPYTKKSAQFASLKALFELTWFGLTWRPNDTINEYPFSRLSVFTNNTFHTFPSSRVRRVSMA